MEEGNVNSHPSMSLLLPVVSVRVYHADDLRVVSQFLEFVPLPPPKSTVVRLTRFTQPTHVVPRNRRGLSGRRLYSARGVSMFRRVLMLSAVLLAGLVPAAAIAQTAGVVGGVVRDSSGGAIPGATVRVINEATSAAQEAVS